MGSRWTAVKQTGSIRLLGSSVGSGVNGRGPTPMYSLSSNGTLPFSMRSGSSLNVTIPSPGVRGSCGETQNDAWSVGGVPGALSGAHGRLHVKPPFVDRLTKMPFRSVSRSKRICA
jgi:hypothetical protein